MPRRNKTKKIEDIPYEYILEKKIQDGIEEENIRMDKELERLLNEES